jgi:thioredoxin-dependent peroxiredoxin
MLGPGDKAPDFTLPDQNGAPFSLSKSLKATKARHLIYFYPKADTPGCATQSCARATRIPA